MIATTRHAEFAFPYSTEYGVCPYASDPLRPAGNVPGNVTMSR